MTVAAAAKEIVIDFKPCGTVVGMHREEFNLSFLGEQQIVRASDIKFDTGLQRWEIWANLRAAEQGEEYELIKEGGQHASYEVARQVEVAWFNACRKEQVSPWSLRGKRIAQAIVAAL